MLETKIDLVCDFCGESLECGEVRSSGERVYSFVKPCKNGCRRTQRGADLSKAGENITVLKREGDEEFPF